VQSAKTPLASVPTAKVATGVEQLLELPFLQLVAYKIMHFSAQRLLATLIVASPAPQPTREPVAYPNARKTGRLRMDALCVLKVGML
jgi:hypothetical protein